MEPDGRITSGCAYERANTLYLSYSATLTGDSSENATITTSKYLLPIYANSA